MPAFAPKGSKMQYIPFRYLSMIEEINQRTVQMALDLTKLTASEAKLAADVDTLLAMAAATQKALDDLKASTGDPAVQQAIDAIQVAMDAESAKVEAATTPPAAPTGAAPTGATGA